MKNLNYNNFLKRGLKIALFALVLFSISFYFGFARDLELVYPAIPGAVVPALGIPLGELFYYIYRFSLIAGFILAFALLVQAGFLRLTSLDNPTKVKEANDRIIAIGLGLLILFSSQIILGVIDPKFLIFPVGEKVVIPPPAPIAPIEIEPLVPAHCAPITTLQEDTDRLIDFLRVETTPRVGITPGTSPAHRFVRGPVYELFMKIQYAVRRNCKNPYNYAFQVYYRNLPEIFPGKGREYSIFPEIGGPHTHTHCYIICLEPWPAYCSWRRNIAKELREEIAEKDQNLTGIEEVFKRLSEPDKTKRLRGTLSSLNNCIQDYDTRLFIHGQAGDQGFLDALKIAREDRENELYFYCCTF